jgi:preprotein translocase subunit YajC
VVDKDEVLIDVADGVSLRVVRSTIAMVQKKDSKAA